jgi:hypothetical protein
MKYICFLAVAIALTGCAAAPEGALKPPGSWQHSKSLSNCGSTDGRFEEIGTPAPENARAGLTHSAWPVMASLSAMVRTGANGMPRGAVSALSIEIVDGRPHFKAYGADGVEVPLPVREWWCDEKALVSRAVLGNVSSAGVPEVRDESLLRIWRAQDGALIAEQTLESVTPGVLGSSSHHRPLTRSYFRFAPAAREAPAPTAPAASSS